MLNIDTIQMENSLISKNKHLMQIPSCDTILYKDNLVTENIHKVYGAFDFKYEMYTFSNDSELIELLRENRSLHKQLNNINQFIERKLISTKQFTEIYGISAETQKQLRRRMKHALPYIQINDTGTIKYKIKTIDKWLENYEKNI